MIPWLTPWLTAMWNPLNAFGYIGVRAACAFAIGLLFAILFGRPLIQRLRSAGVGEDAGHSDDDEVSQAYLASGKSGTPTMGGVFWMSSILVTLLLFCRLDEPLVLIGAVLLVGMGTLGFLDDWIKFKREGGRNGLSRRTKFVASLALAIGVVTIYWALGNPETGYPEIRRIYSPLWKDFFASPDDFGWIGVLLFLGFQTLVVLSCSHAVNVTDGLDGLAAGSAVPTLIALSVGTYAVGTKVVAEYLHLPFIPGAGEVAVMGAAMLGATIGFLWYNGHPAEVFLGDSGSLPLGAGIAYMAIVAKQELALPLLAAVFFVEVLSSLLQIYYYKFTGGKRLFKKAPLHHIWQLAGVPEQKIVLRFWICSAVFAAIGLLTIKLR